MIVEFEVGTTISPVPIEKGEDFEPELNKYVGWGLRVMMKSQPITGTSFLELEKLDTEKISRQVESTLAAAEKTLERFGRLDVEGISAGTKGTLADASATVVEVQGLAKDTRTKVQALRAEEVSQDVRRVLAGLEATKAKIQVAVDRLSVVDVRELNDTLADLRLAARGLAEVLATIREQPSQLLLGGPPAAGKEEER